MAFRMLVFLTFATLVLVACAATPVLDTRSMQAFDVSFTQMLEPLDQERREQFTGVIVSEMIRGHLAGISEPNERVKRFDGMTVDQTIASYEGDVTEINRDFDEFREFLEDLQKVNEAGR